MVRLIYALVIVVLTIGNSVACDGVLGENGHNCDEGKYWDPTSEECEECTGGRYCPKTNSSNGMAYCCPSDFPESDDGATEKEDCYKGVSCKYLDRNLQCERHYDSATICTVGTTSVPVHYENGECYTKYVNCNVFNNNCPNNNVTGYATWAEHNNVEQWHLVTRNNNNEIVSQCECTNNTETCVAKKTTNPKYIPKFTTGITFSPSGYWCTQCKTGYYVNHETDIDTENHTITNCKADSVCQCTKIPKGKYRTSACQEFTYPLNNTNQDICAPSNCPAGKTTDSNGAIGDESNVCKYSPAGTKFCDAKGCFKLNTADWDFD